VSARDDYPWEDIENGPNWQEMCDEIDRLRADLAVMTQGVEDAAEDRDIAQEKVAAVIAALDNQEPWPFRKFYGEVAKAVGR